MNMAFRELTNSPKEKGGERQAVYVDDLVWKIVNKTVTELLATNKFTIVSIAASAAANQTASAALDVANMTGEKLIIFFVCFFFF
jgi:ribosomal protein L12E/L44/L45/RPP1/RPP2